MIRVLLSVAWLGLSGFATAQSAPAPASVQEVSPEMRSFDEAGAVERRATLHRLAPHVTVRRIPVNPGQCADQVSGAYAGGALQVFFERPDRPAALAPLRFSVSLREEIDATRLAPLCVSHTTLVILHPHESIRFSRDPAVWRDYAVAVVMADWAQSLDEGRAPSLASIPPDAQVDLFGVTRGPLSPSPPVAP